MKALKGTPQSAGCSRPARTVVVRCSASQQQQAARRPPAGADAQQPAQQQQQQQAAGPPRRTVLSAVAAAATAAATLLPACEASALGFQKDLNKSRCIKLDPEQFKDGPEGLKYYDFVAGSGPEPKLGNRVVVHFQARWRGITIMDTHGGMGAGGDPFGFNLGAAPGAGGTLKGLDLGVRGMRLGGKRRLLVPPQLAYGDRGYGEVPPGATLEIDVDLLSVKSEGTSRIM